MCNRVCWNDKVELTDESSECITEMRKNILHTYTRALLKFSEICLWSITLQAGISGVHLHRSRSFDFLN